MIEDYYFCPKMYVLVRGLSMTNEQQMLGVISLQGFCNETVRIVQLF